MNTVNLELTEEEARLLSYVLAHVGGDPITSGRRITNAICEKLWDLEMGYRPITEQNNPMDRERKSLHFA